MPYIMTYYPDGDRFHVRLFKETDQINFETCQKEWETVARASLTQLELAAFIVFSETLGAKIEPIEPPQINLGFGR